LGEPLGAAESRLEAVSFKKATEKVWVEEECRMPDGSEFQSDWGLNTKAKDSENTRNRQQVSVCRV